ncbi:DNA-binding protein WhiA, partial [Microbacterium sp. p3-SID131]|uniref:DNA-binding protein WhiA n=1 Tax=Microbacterium sp. p3-SID131 TaxID=2916215 RepID=UPI0021A7CB86
MALTTDVKAELVSIRNAPPTVRVAEVTAILRFAGGLHSIAGRVAVEAEVDAETLARRVARDLAEIYGVRPEIAQVQSSTANDGARWAVRVIAQGETLARQTGLLDQRRRPVRGLPNRLTTGSRAEVAGLWRGAFLAAGGRPAPGRRR